jgi:DnaJ-class molecular chaperone
MTDGGGTTCSNCGGRGSVGLEVPSRYGSWRDCPECDGTGTVEAEVGADP